MTRESNELVNQVESDSKKRMVTLKLDVIDSARMLDFVNRVLPAEHGIVVAAGAGETFNPPVPEAVSDFAVYPLFENEITTEAVTNLYKRQHLAWDESTQTAVFRNGDPEP